MSLTWLRQWMKKAVTTSRRKKGRADRRSRPVRLGIEALEDRRLLNGAALLPPTDPGSPASSSSPAVASLSLTGFPSADVSGVAHYLTVSAVDASGHSVTGYQDTVHFSSSDPSAVLPANYTFTPADKGSHTFLITLNNLATQALTVTDTSDSKITATQAGINVVSQAAYAAATENSIIPQAPASLAISGLPATVTAGQPFQITVTAKDASSQTDTATPNTIHFASSDGFAWAP